MRKILLFLFLLAGTASFAQWARTSSYYSGEVVALSSSPEAICMLTNDGVSILKAGDPRWYPLRTIGNLSSGYSNIAGNDNLIVINSDNDYYITRDGGVTWSEPTGPNSIRHLYLMGEVIIGIDWSNTLHYSNDYGLNWNSLTSTLSLAYPAIMNNEIYNIAYIGDQVDKLYKSVFNGTSFTAWQEVLTFQQYDFHYSLMSFNGILYAGSDTGIQRSADKGLHWTTSGPDGIEIIVSDSVNLIACMGITGGIYSSPIENLHWNTILPKYTDEYAHHIAACSGRFYADLWYQNIDLGLLTYAGNKWRQIDALPVGGDNTGISCVRKTDNVLFTSVAGIVHTSSDAGNTWPAYKTDEYWTVKDAVHSGNNYLIAGSEGIGIVDLVNDTITLTAGINGYQAYSLEKYGSILYAGTADGIYTSADDGSHWIYKYLKGKIIYSLEVCRDTLYAGTDQGLFFAPDGMSWGITACLTADIHNIAATANDIFVTSASGLLKRDAANAWLPVSTVLVGTDVTDIVARDNRLYAATAHGTVLFTEDGGNSWTDISEGSFMNVTGLALSGNKLFMSEKVLGVLSYTVPGPIGIAPVRGNTVLSVFPNPVKDHFSMSLPSTIKEISNIEILNTSGIIVKTISHSVLQNNKILVDVGNLPSGLYLLMFRNREQKFSVRFCRAD